MNRDLNIFLRTIFYFFGTVGTLIGIRTSTDHPTLGAHQVLGAGIFLLVVAILLSRKGVSLSSEESEKRSRAKAEAKERAKRLAHRCPKCGGSDYYPQPRDIPMGAGLSRTSYVGNVAICRSCDVELVPRRIL